MMTEVDTSVRRDGSIRDLLTRPAVNEPHIRVRPDGRQLVIDRGPRPEADADEQELVSEADTEAETKTPTRGRITHFSEDSRRRLRRTFHALERDADSLFLTLTWHEGTPTPDEAHAALRRFWKRVRRRFPHVAAIWKMEPQKRGTPHFHLLIYGIRWVDAQWISALWHDCTDETSDEHERSGVDVEWIRCPEKTLAYLSKYMSKTGEPWPEAAGPEWKHPGRFWGVLDRENLPVAAWADWSTYIGADEAAWLIRTLLDEWEIDTGGALPPSLTINTRGDPEDRLSELLARLPA